MSRAATWASTVQETALLSAGLRHFVLARTEGGDYPAFSPGSHITLGLEAAGRRWRNAYSLVSPPGRRDRLGIIVRRVAHSRGGSEHMHERLRPGDAVEVSGPINLFPINRTARRHLMLSAGIGVTPFLTYLPALLEENTPFALHHVSRPEDLDAFHRLLTPQFGPSVTVHSGRGTLDLDQVLRDEGLGTHLSVCGPEAFMTDVMGRAGRLGWPSAKIHREAFTAPAGGAAFLAELRDGRRIQVAPEMSLLEALEDAGVDAPSLCRGGACGQCRVGVLAGVPEHRDHVLDDRERARGDCILTCVSRARGTLVLDL